MKPQDSFPLLNQFFSNTPQILICFIVQVGFTNRKHEIKCFLFEIRKKVQNKATAMKNKLLIPRDQSHASSVK